jgi:2,4-dienoyl-CoA reductase-like NADH-dependent reductase (Old Yellow Enzyme family)
MAHYFKYKSVADLEAESPRLGLSLRYTDDFAPLFRPAPVGPLTAGNALCVQPMEGCDSTPDGKPDELTFRRYQRFGAGGAKLIWGEAVAVIEEGRANSRQLLATEANLPALAKMLDVCRQAHQATFGDDGDLVIGLQLTHSGRYCYRRPLIATHDAALDQRTIADKATGRRVDASYPLLEDDYLKRLVDHYVVAAKLARRAGYQFVDIKQCHRYLLNELLGARSRLGPFGGGYENRTRLARDIIGAIRAAVPGLMVATRMNVFDGLPFRTGPDGTGVPCDHPHPLVDGWGMDLNDPLQPDLTEPLRWIGEMRSLGVALVNVTLGNPYAGPHILRPFEYPPPDGYETPEHPLVGVDRHFRLTAQVQAAHPDLPVVGSGYSFLQEFLPHAAAANVRDHRCTFAGVGRATLAQPDFVKQLLDHGRLDRKRVCRTFSYCTALMRSKHNELGQYATGCPPFDKEVYGPIWQECQQLDVRKGERGGN